MFVLVAQRPEFLGKWRPALAGRGEVLVTAGLAELQAKLQDAVPAAVVIDRQLLGNVVPGFLVVLKKLCRESCLVLGDTSYQAEDELLALAAGVSGCCDTSLAGDELDRVLGVVLAGGIWISRRTLPALAGRLEALVAVPEERSGGLGGLTQRQREVAELVAAGESNKRIAQHLNITDRTVKAHLTSIFEKLGLADRLQLALFVTRRPADS